MEKSLVLIKPDAVERNIIGEIISFYERQNLKITALKLLKATREIAEQHYAEHKGKPYYEELIEFITRSPLCAMVVEGEDAIATVRKTNGNTDPSKADKDTIRGTFGISKTENSVHSSDSPDNAEKEIKLWF
ncbi:MULTISPECIES: nucleoside-diphosphate kinase [Clostridium]|uniref:Nucleoside diphosphate kinase n=1 Tax=Clostridium novyi (strain NT) TaxID=386415 RepID=A0Q290_CLONN|nr:MULTISPECIES: nucleoside-diphosphate kinase [Clostridium]ABK62353.1 Nucleoside diphosphate kinase (NDK) (NDP kinase)(Nucleoside-2-P kinase) [Clostridium novyi NT]KEH85308.1 nucleoside diphosphate kinase [Clostridium novyi A str. 4540]KEH85616.1 nucleoside diphosphate kinase [Clostridium novyi A str. BKT29909]KEH86292.1 nucleoside diphosphate kinase [Clostridium novyi A str. NCTC 538]KEH91493.1 nucleoside diphosphate kinase [Clostridium novyi A str. GD211209]